MSSTRRKFHLRQPVVVDIGCGCQRAKLSSFFFPSSSSPLKRKTPKSPLAFSPSTTTATTTTSFSPSSSSSQSFDPPKRTKAKQGNYSNSKKGVVEESVAVEKESSDPYFDFRDSMLQMIVEKEIYAWDDLRELLHRFLSLNSPYHHHLILRAFAEIWNGVFSPASPSHGRRR